MPPAGAPAPAAVPASQGWHAEFSGTTLLAPTAMALMPPAAAPAYAPGRSAQSSPALPLSRTSPAPFPSPPIAPTPIAAPARVSAGPSSLVQAAIIDTSIFALETPAAPAAAETKERAAPVAAAPAVPTKAPATAAAPTTGAAAAAAPASSDPWAAFDDAFADAASPSQLDNAATVPTAAAASGGVHSSPVRPALPSAAPSPARPVAAASPAVSANAPVAPAVVDPTAGLDLFFTAAPVAAPAVSVAAPVTAGVAASPSMGVLPGPPPLSEEEAAALRRRKEKAKAKRASTGLPRS